MPGLPISGCTSRRAPGSGADQVAQDAPSSVLLVEDDRAIATVIEAALEDEGFAIHHCTSIAERDAAMAQTRFDVMVTDVILDDGDGIASLAKVRDAAPGRPLIVLTGLDDAATAALMAHFYEALAARSSPGGAAEALHLIQGGGAMQGRPLRILEELGQQGDGGGIVGMGGAERGRQRAHHIGQPARLDGGRPKHRRCRGGPGRGAGAGPSAALLRSSAPAVLDHTAGMPPSGGSSVSSRSRRGLRPAR